MAIQLITTPQVITPAFNPVNLRFSATTVEYTAEGFQYWLKLKVNNEADEYNIKIRPNLEGIGTTDTSKLLQSYINAPSYTLIGNAPAYTLTQNTWNNVDFNIEYGYEKYVKYAFDSLALVTINSKRYVKLNNTPNDYLFVNGDQINITSVNPTNDPEIKVVDGIHTVISAATNYIIIDVVIPTGASLPTTTGIVEFADKRKVEEITATGTTTYIANNVAMPIYDYSKTTFKDYDWRKHVATFDGTSTAPIFIAKLTSSIANGHIINQYERPVVNLQFKDIADGSVLLVTQTTTDNLTTRLTSYTLPSGNTYTNVSIPVYLIPGSEDKDITITFKYFSTDDGDVIDLFEPLTLKASKKCPINSYVLQFLDRNGALSTFSFPGRAYVNGQVTKKDFNQFFEDYATTRTSAPSKFENNTLPYQYNYQDFGLKTINVSDTITLELNTLNEQWNDSQNKMWGELISSPSVYLIVDGDYNNRIAVTVKDNSYDINSELNKRLTSKKIKIEYANKNNINI